MRAAHLVHPAILRGAAPFAAACPDWPAPGASLHGMSPAALAAVIRESCQTPLAQSDGAWDALFATPRGKLLLSLAAWATLPRGEAEALSRDLAAVEACPATTAHRLRAFVTGACTGCGTVATATVAMMAAAKAAAPGLTSARYLWTRGVDPAFWCVVNGHGRPAHHAGAVGPFALRAAEVELGEPLTLGDGEAEFLAERALSRLGP